jgi:small RNA 2'-O-methyltransferase
VIDGRVLGWGGSTALHDERLDAVAEQLLGGGTGLLLDLGCGSGALMERLLLESGVRHVVGVDSSPVALCAARRRLDTLRNNGRWTLREGSVTDAQEDLPAVDGAALVETIEHLNPSHLSRLERALFAVRPAMIVVTTPNREYNPVYGLAPGEYRHPHHRRHHAFEARDAELDQVVVPGSDRPRRHIHRPELAPRPRCRATARLIPRRDPRPSGG